MYLPPLFGPDSIPHFTSRLFAIFGTAILWLVFFICMIFIKVEPKKPEYKEVQIVLSSEKLDFEKEKDTEQAQVESEAGAMFQEEAALTEETPSEPPAEAPQSTVETLESPTQIKEEPVAKTLETPKEQPTPAKQAEPKKQPETPNPQTQPAKTEPVKTVKETTPKKPLYEIQKSTEELMEEQYASKKTYSADYDPFASMEDSDSEPVKQSEPVKTVNTQSSIGGTAAKTNTDKTTKQTSKQNNNYEKSAESSSSSTSKALSDIAATSTTNYSSSTGSTKAIASVNTAKSDGKVYVEMSNGSSRALIEPLTPVIKLSEASASLIESDRTVKISFKVIESGNVPLSEITIEPESILPQPVRDEIKNQLSKWRFESASYAAKATFEYTIIKK